SACSALTISPPLRLALAQYLVGDIPFQSLLCKTAIICDDFAFSHKVLEVPNLHTVNDTDKFLRKTQKGANSAVFENT
ncbi:MAG: hypothetical protein MJ193_01115, partial [Clostridia bacterium]|nr:hypothetical protein [Clostridia bacterium]